MFGYVRPVREELKCKDFDLYRATYCGLCRELRRKYGLLAPMFLNFDFTFLALLLWPAEERFAPCRGRCHANPLVRKEMCPASPALEAAADESIILTYWKLRDAARDDGPIGGLPARGLALLLAPAYRKAAECRPEFDRTVRACLEELTGLEAENCPSIDRTADTFARILQAAAPPPGTGAGTGRWSSSSTTWGGGSISSTPGTTWRRTAPPAATTPSAPDMGRRGTTRRWP